MKKKKRFFLDPQYFKKYGGFRKLYVKFLNEYNKDLYNQTKIIIPDDKLDKLKFLYRWITGQELPKGIYLFGSYGTGKTATIFALKKMLNLHRKIKFLTANEVIENYRILYDNIIDFNKFRNAELIIIDDFGSEENREIVIFGNRIRPLTDLIEYRYRRGLWTWFTSNIPPRKLPEMYGGYIADRLKEMVYFIKWDGKSYRK